MSTLYERIVSGDGITHQKIDIQGLMNDTFFWLDEDFDENELASRHNLTEEQRDVWLVILDHLKIKKKKRHEDFFLLWQSMFGLERGVLTWEEAMDKLGVEFE